MDKTPRAARHGRLYKIIFPLQMLKHHKYIVTMEIEEGLGTPSPSTEVKQWPMDFYVVHAKTPVAIVRHLRCRGQTFFSWFTFPSLANDASSWSGWLKGSRRTMPSPEEMGDAHQKKDRHTYHIKHEDWICGDTTNDRRDFAALLTPWNIFYGANPDNVGQVAKNPHELGQIYPTLISGGRYLRPRNLIAFPYVPHIHSTEMTGSGWWDDPQFPINNQNGNVDIYKELPGDADRLGSLIQSLGSLQQIDEAYIPTLYLSEKPNFKDCEGSDLEEWNLVSIEAWATDREEDWVLCRWQSEGSGAIHRRWDHLRFLMNTCLFSANICRFLREIKLGGKGSVGLQLFSPKQIASSEYCPEQGYRFGIDGSIPPEPERLVWTEWQKPDDFIADFTYYVSSIHARFLWVVENRGAAILNNRLTNARVQHHVATDHLTKNKLRLERNGEK